MLPDSVNFIASNAFSALRGANVSIDGRITGIAVDAFGSSGRSLGNLLIRGPEISSALCSSLLSNLSIGKIFVTPESGLSVNSRICDGRLIVSGINRNVTPFPTVRASPSPHLTFNQPTPTESPKPTLKPSDSSGSSCNDQSGVSVLLLVGAIFGAFVLGALAVWIPTLVLKRYERARHLKGAEVRLASDVGQ
jgi:hypothetical protein